MAIAFSGAYRGGFMSDRSLTAPGGVSRREFTLQSALALLAGVTITISGCGSNSPTTPTPVGDVNGVIAANHGHVATIRSAQIAATNAISLDITGEANHPHTVTLTQAQLQSLQARQTVTTESTNNSSHTHVVTFTAS
jgi:hypothetical protein